MCGQTGERGCPDGEMGSSRGERPRRVKWAGAAEGGESFRGNRKSRSRGARGAGVGTLGPSGSQAQLQVSHGSPSQTAWCPLMALASQRQTKTEPGCDSASPPGHCLCKPGPAGPPLRPNDERPAGFPLPSDHLLTICGPGHQTPAPALGLAPACGPVCPSCVGQRGCRACV